MSKQFPTQAQVVIVGGGVVGCSLAYHLTKLGWMDVVLLERKQLTCGTTWHAAGLVGQLRATQNMTKLAQYTAELFGKLEEETGQATGFAQHGSLSLATNEGRFEELKRGASMARCFGLEVDVISASEAQNMWPMINVDDVVGAVYLPKDGKVNPIDVTQALADAGVPVVGGQLKTAGGRVGDLFTVQVKNRDQLRTLYNRVLAVPGVLSIERVDEAAEGTA